MGAGDAVTRVLWRDASAMLLLVFALLVGLQGQAPPTQWMSPACVEHGCVKPPVTASEDTP